MEIVQDETQEEETMTQDEAISVDRLKALEKSFEEFKRQDDQWKKAIHKRLYKMSRLFASNILILLLIYLKLLIIIVFLFKK